MKGRVVSSHDLLPEVDCAAHTYQEASGWVGQSAASSSRCSEMASCLLVEAKKAPRVLDVEGRCTRISLNSAWCRSYHQSLARVCAAVVTARAT